jgi:hypothetical protein
MPKCNDFTDVTNKKTQQKAGLFSIVAGDGLASRSTTTTPI